MPTKRGPYKKRVVLENNNGHLTRLSAEGLPLFLSLLSSPQEEQVPGFCHWADPGEPESADALSVRPSAW